MPRPLTIGVDIRDLQVARTGTRTYLEELCNEFRKMEANDVRFHFLDTLIPVYGGNNKVLKLFGHVRYQFWKQVSLPLKAFFKGCDVVFCTDNFVPLVHLGYKTIPVFHDAFFFETPENYGKLWLWLYKRTAIPAAKRSPIVVTPSAWAKKQINHYTGIANDKLAVVYEGAKTLNRETAENATLSSFQISPKNYLLHVGSMFKRKNIPALVKAFDKVKTEGYPDLKLVLAGPVPTNNIDSDHQEIMDAIAGTKWQNDIIITGYLPSAELAWLYNNALLYVFPSINEGFGIPVLEAFSSDLPVLAANNTCLPEIGGNAIITFDPFDTDDISLKIKMALDDPALRADMIKKGADRLQQFSWRNAAEELIALFKKVA